MRTLALGDVHGCSTALTALLRLVRPGPEDRIVFLGDYIDRGPGSREVIDTLLRLETGGSMVFSGIIKSVGFAICIDTASAQGGWLSCLDVITGKYWQATEKGDTREGTL